MTTTVLGMSRAVATSHLSHSWSTDTDVHAFLAEHCPAEHA
jgi:hypothetical protein